MTGEVFTKEEDNTILKGHLAGKSWVVIGIETGRSVNSVKKRYYRHLRGHEVSLPPSTNGKVHKNGKVGVSLDEFVASNDYITKIRLAIRKGVSSLKPGMLLKDADFRTECNCNHNSWRHVADEDQFLPYQLVIDGRYWWARPETIQEALIKVPKARALE